MASNKTRRMDEKDTRIKGSAVKNRNRNKKRTYDGDSETNARPGQTEGKNYFKSPENDVEWYVANPQLVVDSASFAYSYALGTPADLGPLADRQNLHTVPGIMKIKFIPTVGWSDSNVSPVNVAARKMYSFIRQANSGAKNYDSPDLIMYILAMDSAISYLEWMKRIYGVVQLASMTNRYYPKAIIESMKIDYDDVAGKLADFRYYINSYATRLRALAVPGNITFIAKHQQMVSGLYLDGEVGKSQTYYFEPEGFYIFTHDEDGAGYLDFTYQFDGVVGPGTQLQPISKVQEFGDKILNAILYGYGEEDFNLISGDILKAYGSNIYRVEGITELYTVIPVKDERILSQIENAVGVGKGVDYYTDVTDMTSESKPGGTFHQWTEAFDIRQSDNKSHIVSTPTVYYPYATRMVSPLCADKILNMHHANPTPADSLYASRLMNIPTLVSDVDNVFTHTLKDYVEGNKHYVWYKTSGLEVRTASSEIVTAFYIYDYAIQYGTPGNQMILKEFGPVSYDVDFAIATQLTPADSWPGGEEASTPQIEGSWNTFMYGIVNKLDLMTLLTNFDWHPFIQVQFGYRNTAYMFDTSAYSTNPYVTSPIANFGDVQNYTIVHKDNLINIANVAMLSMLGLQ